MPVAYSLPQARLGVAVFTGCNRRANFEATERNVVKDESAGWKQMRLHGFEM